MCIILCTMSNPIDFSSVTHFGQLVSQYSGSCRLFLLGGEIGDGVGYFSDKVLLIYKACTQSPVPQNTSGIKQEAVSLLTSLFPDCTLPKKFLLFTFYWGHISSLFFLLLLSACSLAASGCFSS